MATSTAALLCHSPRTSTALSARRPPHGVAGATVSRRTGAAGAVRACFNPLGDERILREAIKNALWKGKFAEISGRVAIMSTAPHSLEPVAFMGGVFAGLLRLDLNEDPLKEWITRTVDASGIAEESSSEESSEANQNDAPQQIEIE